MTKEESDKLCCGDPGYPYGWIQWKGTDVCIDLHCSCGHDGHIDADFLYHWKCRKCKKIWALDCHVKLFEITDGEPKYSVIEDKKTSDEIPWIKEKQ